MGREIQRDKLQRQKEEENMGITKVEKNNTQWSGCKRKRKKKEAEESNVSGLLSVTEKKHVT